MKKLLIFCVVVGFVFAISGMAQADTLYVGPSETYTTIQEAIDEAIPGDTIEVAAGTYNEALIVDKSISLVGAKANVDPRGGAWTSGVSVIFPGSGNTGIDIQASNVTVNGFEVQGGVYGIYIGYVDVNNVIISYNDLHSNSKYGLQAIGIGSDISWIDVSLNYIRDNGRNGLKLVDVTDCVVDSNEFAGNGFGSYATKPEYKYGVFLEDERYNSDTYSPCIRNTFIGNSFHDNNFGAINMEVMGNAQSIHWASTQFLEDTVVQNNKFYGDSSTWGINVSNDYKDDGTQSGFGPIATVDATNNWWGDATGPYHPTTNSSGTGNEVSDNVDYDPWLQAPS